MRCPTCGADVREAVKPCPWCGALPNRERANDGVVVESIAERALTRADRPLLAPMEGIAVRSLQPTSVALTPEPRRVSVTIMPDSLPTLLWRQPAVRAVARAGAGALALSLGMRLLRAWLIRPDATRQLTRTALPMVARRLQPGPPPHARAPRDASVVETWIYVRQFVHER